jgi:hypothetical protein
MRLRQLGHGHSVRFLAPKEVFSQLQLLSNSSHPDSSHVINWALRNTAKQLQNGMIDWATQGLNFSRRLAAMDLIKNGTDSARWISFAKLVKIPESTQLASLYGEVQSSTLANEVVASVKGRLIESLSADAREATDRMETIGQEIQIRCDRYISQMTINSKCLDEEQERELEEEKEEEKEIQRPTAEQPFTPTEPAKLREWIRNDRSPEFKKNLLPLWQAMEYTTAYQLLPKGGDGFDKRILTTYNFRRTLKYSSIFYL